MRFKRISLMILPFLSILMLASCSDSGIKPYILQEFHMGTVITEKVYGRNAQKAAREAMDKIEKIESLMTINKEGSEIDILNDNAGENWVKLSSETIYVLETAKKFSEISKGSFDVTIGPLVKAWGVATQHPRVPEAEEIKSLKALTNYRDLLIDREASKAMLKRKGQMVDLGGIAKGYAADKVVEIYKKYGIKSAYINLGGNVKVLGSKPDGSPWKVGIQNPRAPTGKIVGIVKITDKTVVSSGDYERYFFKDSQRYHHILDPKTGYPAKSGLIGTTIITDNSIDADALSTAVFVLGLEKGKKLIEGLKGVEGIFITEDKKIFVTEGLKNNFIFDDESKEFEYVKKR